MVGEDDPVQLWLEGLGIGKRHTQDLFEEEGGPPIAAAGISSFKRVPAFFCCLCAVYALLPDFSEG